MRCLQPSCCQSVFICAPFRIQRTLFHYRAHIDQDILTSRPLGEAQVCQQALVSNSLHHVQTPFRPNHLATAIDGLPSIRITAREPIEHADFRNCFLLMRKRGGRTVSSSNHRRRYHPLRKSKTACQRRGSRENKRGSQHAFMDELDRYRSVNESV